MLGENNYGWTASEVPASHKILLPAFMKTLTRLKELVPAAKILDLGCGNGVLTNYLASQGYDIVGVEPSDDGIASAIESYPSVKFHQASAYDDLTELGAFDAVISLEVIEHLYFPRKLVATSYRMLTPGGVLIISTPYHGYLKNLIIAIIGGWDKHHTSLQDHMHIKFFSVRMLTKLLNDEGFHVLSTKRVGRIPQMAKSMVLIAEKPLVNQ